MIVSELKVARISSVVPAVHNLNSKKVFNVSCLHID